MNIHKIATTLGICWVAATATAQTPPEQVRTLFPRENTPGKELVSEKTLSADQRAFMHHKTTKQKDGYFKVEVPPTYLAQLSELASSPLLKTGRRDHLNMLGKLALLGTVDEGEYRKTYLFGDQRSADRMVTLWQYKQAGASMVVVEENLNQKIGSMEATLSLAFNPTTEACLWKVVAVEPHTMAELVIADKMRGARPSKSVGQVLREANDLFAREQ